MACLEGKGAEFPVAYLRRAAYGRGFWGARLLREVYGEKGGGEEDGETSVWAVGLHRRPVGWPPWAVHVGSLRPIWVSPAAG